MIDKALLKRIRKCLALSASANEHEAAAALGKARTLMAEHGISDADLAMAEIEEAAARGSRAQRPARWEQLLCASVRRALGVEVFRDRAGDRRYVGHGPTAEIAAYAFVALFRRLKAARAEYIRTTLKRCTIARKRVRADAFCEGWAIAVHAQIAALRPKRPLDPAIETYLRVHHPGLSTVAVRPSAADAGRTSNDLHRGFARGDDERLHAGLSDTDRLALR